MKNKIYVKLRNDTAKLTHEFLIESYQVTSEFFILKNATSLFSHKTYYTIKYSRKLWRTI